MTTKSQEFPKAPIDSIAIAIMGRDGYPEIVPLIDYLLDQMDIAEDAKIESLTINIQVNLELDEEPPQPGDDLLRSALTDIE